MCLFQIIPKLGVSKQTCSLIPTNASVQNSTVQKKSIKYNASTKLTLGFIHWARVITEMNTTKHIGWTFSNTQQLNNSRSWEYFMSSGSEAS